MLVAARFDTMPELISEDAADQVVRTCRTAIGDSLRSITVFTEDGYEQLYLRGDLERDADLSRFVVRESVGFRDTESAYADSELGRYEYTLRSFANGYLLRVTAPEFGTFVTTDAVTLRDFEELSTALGRLLADLHRD